MMNDTQRTILYNERDTENETNDECARREEVDTCALASNHLKSRRVLAKAKPFKIFNPQWLWLTFHPVTTERS